MSADVQQAEPADEMSLFGYNTAIVVVILPYEWLDEK